MIRELSDYLFLVFATLFPIMNPPAAAMIVLSATRHDPPPQQRRIARRTVLYGGLILIAVLLVGRAVIDFFGVSLAAIRVAGGLVVVLIGNQMLFPSATVSDVPTGPSRGDIALVPLAMPGLIGPGSLAAVIGIAARIPSDRAIEANLMVILGIVLVCLATLLVFLLALRSATHISPARAEAMARIMGFLLVAIGVEFVLSGIRSYYGIEVHAGG